MNKEIDTTYMQGEGTVTKLTSLQTKVLLDSEKELTFLNSSILSGSIAVAKIQQTMEKIKILRELNS